MIEPDVAPITVWGLRLGIALVALAVLVCVAAVRRTPGIGPGIRLVAAVGAVCALVVAVMPLEDA